MTSEWIGVIAVVALLTLTLLRVPIGIVLLCIGFLGNFYFLGFDASIAQTQLVIWEVATNFILITLPLFVWLGALSHHSGIGRDLYMGFNRWIGHISGGLGLTSIVSSAGFGAITGSSVATVSAMGNMLMPEMKRYRYDMGLATGSLASAGVLAILIPPSIPLVFYSAWTETSLADLFVAGIVPGLILTFLYLGLVYFRCRFNPNLAQSVAPFSWRERFLSLSAMMPAISVIVMVFGSIYGGYATPTEAAAVGVFWVLLLAIFRKRLSLKAFKESVHQSASLSGNIFILFLGGVVFSRFLAQTNLTSWLIEFIGASGMSPMVIMLMLVVMYLLLGAILDTFGMIILTLPLVFPLVTALGYDPVWFGIFIVMMIELSLITPPIGINVFVMKRVAPDVPIETIFYGTAPFVVITLLFVLCLVVFPDLVLWLPDLLAS